LGGHLDGGDFFSSHRQLFHLKLFIIFINNVIHTRIISYINALASENFAPGLKYLWKTSKKVTSSQDDIGSVYPIRQENIDFMRLVGVPLDAKTNRLSSRENCGKAFHFFAHSNVY
jgi:hypothetical protein